MNQTIAQPQNKPAVKPRARVILTLLGILVLCLAIFLHPQMLFGWSVSVDNLTLYSDQPFLPQSGTKLLEQVQQKLAASPLYSNQKQFDIFICNTSWRRVIFFIGAENAGGVVYYPLSSNVFLSGGVIAENRLVSPSRNPDVLGRKLDHFVTHEIAHILNGEAVGGIKFHYLPVWIKEGYAEYMGSQGVFNQSEAAQAFLDNSYKMNFPPSVPYLRYNLLVAYLLKNKNWTEKQLFETTLTQAQVEQMLRADLSR